MIAIIGSEGAMGKRYQALLSHMKKEFLPLDKSKPEPDRIIERAKTCDRIIICSPTESHVGYLKELLPLKKPILCETPITKNLDELFDLHAECRRRGWQYQMVMQYKELEISREPYRLSHYHDFRCGPDGLAWDCLQIIGLARGEISLKKTSPVWECSINGRALNIRDMDQAYVTMVHKWLMNELDQTMDEVLDMHTKVTEYLERMEA